MSKNRTAILAWVVCLSVIVLATAQTVNTMSRLGYAPTAFDLVETFGWGWAIPITFSITGALIISKQPGNRVGWLLMLPVIIAISPANYLATPRTALTPALWLLLWLDTWSWIAVIFPVLLIPLHFPTGRPPSPRWRWINWLAVGMWLLFMFFVAFGPEIGPLNYDWRLANPLGILPNQLIDAVMGPPWVAGLLVITVGSVLSLVVRFRRAGLVEREQIKWVLYAAALFGLAYITVLGLNSVAGDESMGALTNLLLVLGLLSLPVAITIAILRYRLFDIDIIIRKTVVYAALSALLAVVYFGSVFLLQALLGRFVGAESPLILVISTLLIAALFSPLRRAVQGWIDRRFYRRKFDAQQVLARFASSARSQTDLAQMREELTAVIEETLQPQIISVWTAGPPSSRQG
ncbi:MAG: hypothetical protein ACK2UK_17345 [Candidatus Promineifilaceae bacterium]